MGPLRQQLPVRSPLSLAGLARATLRAASSDPRPALEERLARRFSADSVVLLDSGTHALELALRIAGEGRTGPVLVPAYSCYDIATAVLGAGTDAILYDIDPETLTPDMASVRDGLAHQPSALVVGPLYGMAFPLDALRDAAHGVGAVLVEDAAQGHGASVGDRPSGSLGDLSILSFGRGKGWTGGGGGALLMRAGTTVSEDGRGRGGLDARSTPGAVVLGSKTLAQWLLARPSLYRVPASLPWLGLGETHYKPPSPISRMSPWSAALILAGEAAADAEARLRRARGSRIVDEIVAMPGGGVEPVMPAPGCTPGFLRIPVLREGGMDGLPPDVRRRGIAPGYPRSLVDLPPFAPGIRNRDAGLPGARRLARDLVTLPSHGAVREAEIPELLQTLSPADGL